MARIVKPLTRRDRASATRIRIIASAASCFSARGYAGSTMETIASDAGVAVQTVYFVFHTKPHLLIETIAHLAWGGDPRTSAGRSWIQAATDAPDGVRRLGIVVDDGVELYRRAAPLFPVLVEASAIDPDVRTAWQRIVDERRAGMTQMAELMATRGELRRGISAERTADLCVGLHRHELYLAFTRECGWSVEAFKAWLYITLCRELLPPEIAKEAIVAGSAATSGLSFSGELADST